MIQKAHQNYVIPGDMKEDWKLTADSILSVGELTLINASIKPVDADTRNNPNQNTSRFAARHNRPKILNLDEIDATVAELDKKNAENPIEGLAANWEVATFASALSPSAIDTDSAQLLSGIYGMPAALTEVFAKAMAVEKLSEHMRPGVIRLQDSSGNYSGIITINDGSFNGRVASVEEINSMLGTVMSVGNVMHLPGTPGAVASKDLLGDTGMDIFITDANRELRYKVGLAGRVRENVLAYANTLYGVTIFSERVRESKRDRDRGLRDNLTGGPNSHFSNDIKPDTMDVWEHVTAHEVGHVVAGRAGVDVSREQANKPAPSLYGGASSDEKFAEYFALYMKTGKAPEWFIDILRSRNLLKSQQNQN